MSETYRVAHLTAFLDSEDEKVQGLEAAIKRAMEMAEERDEQEFYYHQPFGVWHEGDCVAIAYAGQVFTL